MFVIFGNINKQLDWFEETGAECDHCDEALSYIVSVKYFHIFWIPFFPIYKYVSSYCSNCDTYKKKVYGKNAALIQKQSKTPLYLYSGLIIVIVVLLNIFIEF